MSRVLERAEWVRLGDRLRELKPKRYEKLVRAVRVIVEGREAVAEFSRICAALAARGYRAKIEQELARQRARAQHTAEVVK